MQYFCRTFDDRPRAYNLAPGDAVILSADDDPSAYSHDDFVRYVNAANRRGVPVFDLHKQLAFLPTHIQPL